MFDLIVLTERPRSPVRRAVKQLKRKISGVVPAPSQITRSLLGGLALQDKVTWAHVANYRGERARTIYVVHDHHAVEAAIKAKRAGLCDRLVIGPDGIIPAPEVDVFILQCEWWREYQTKLMPAIADRVVLWPCGVNPTYWKPPEGRRQKVLIYEKRRPGVARQLAALLESAGYKSVIVVYGTYTLESYRRDLASAFACIVVADQETQGVAMYEAWSMNVPTFVEKYEWDPNFGCRCSASPYLSEMTGTFWEDQGELPRLLASAGQYAPRQWVLENATDLIAAEALLKIALPTERPGR